jgi:alpha-1,6-mannosyltransferase
MILTLVLLLFPISTYFLAHYGNIGKDVYPFLALSILQYGIYFYILKRVFSEKRLPILLITICSIISIGIYMYHPPKLSNDVYRYLWDGLIQKEGYNPYLYVPGDWKFHDLQEANMKLFRHVDWRDKFTPYPPVAQYIFKNAHTLFDQYGLIGGKFLFALPIILSALLLYFLVDKKLYAIFVLNPLLLLEVVANAHLDGWVIFFMIAGLYLYNKKKYIPASLVWTLAIATKVYPIIFVPFFLFDLLRQKKFKEVIISILLSTGLLYLLYRPFIGESLFPIMHYLTLPNEQEYNASLYRYIYLLLGINNIGVYVLAAKICGYLFAIGVLILLLIKKYSYTLLLVVGILYLLCSPIVFPWYSLFTFVFVLFHISQTKDFRLMYFYAFIQLLMTIIYFEPGKLYLREIMLNLEYFLLLLSILFYTKVLSFPRGFLSFPRRRATLEK